MLKRRVLGAIVFVTVMALLLVACGTTERGDDSTSGDTTPSEQEQGSDSTAAGGEKVLYVALDGDWPKLDPHTATSGNEMPIINSLYNGLVRWKPGTTEFEGDLAEEWTHNEDATEWTFRLRQGVQTQCGFGELTAADVKASFERNMDPNNALPYAADFEEVEAITTNGDYEVTFHLKQPNPLFLFKVQNYHGGYILPEEAIQLGDELNRRSCGTGPFQMVRNEAQNQVVLEAFDQYFRGRPKIDRIVYRFMPDLNARLTALKNGEVHIFLQGPDPSLKQQLESDPNVRLYFESPGTVFYVMYNLTRKPLDQLKVRQALNYALDKEAIRDYFGVQNIPCSFVVEGYVGHAPDVMCYPYDPEKAKQLLAEAGYPNGFDMGEVIASTRDVHIDNFLLMQDMWSKIGVTFTIKRVDHSTYHEATRADKNPIVEYGFVRPLYAHVPLYEFFHSDAIVGKETAVTNFSHYDGIDHLLDEAAQTPDLNRRIELWQEAQRKLAEDAVYSPLVQANRFLVVSAKVRLGYEDQLKDRMIPTQWYFPIITEQTELLD